jgi:hypothetical protein
MAGRFDALQRQYATCSDGSPEMEAANYRYIRYRDIMGGLAEATPEEAAEYDVTYPGWEVSSYRKALYELRERVSWYEKPSRLASLNPEQQARYDEIKAEIARFEIKLAAALAKAPEVVSECLLSSSEDGY